MEVSGIAGSAPSSFAASSAPSSPYSSLSLALELPFDELKVDMSFIKDIEQKPQNQAMVQSIVDYANRTNTETCIEGIENQEVSDYIHQFGATWHQGYFYSKPVPIEQFEALLDVPH